MDWRAWKSIASTAGRRSAAAFAKIQPLIPLTLALQTDASGPQVCSPVQRRVIVVTALEQATRDAYPRWKAVH
jgi:hypothetical protein